MPFSKPTNKETVAEAVTAALSDIRLIETFDREQQQKQNEAAAELAEARGDHADATQRLILAGAAISAGPKVVHAAKQRLAKRSREIAVHVEALMGELVGLHEQASEIVRQGVQNAIAKTLGVLGWWTNPELMPLVVRARPVREQHAFEAQHQAMTRIGFYNGGTGGEYANIVSYVHGSSFEEPGLIAADIARLTASVSAAKARLEAVKREFGGK